MGCPSHVWDSWGLPTVELSPLRCWSSLPALASSVASLRPLSTKCSRALIGNPTWLLLRSSILLLWLAPCSSSTSSSVQGLLPCRPIRTHVDHALPVDRHCVSIDCSWSLWRIAQKAHRIAVHTTPNPTADSSKRMFRQ